MSVYENKIIVIVIAFIEFFGKGRGYYLEICNSTFESHCIWSMFELPNEIAKDYVNMIFRIAQYEKKISAMLTWWFVYKRSLRNVFVLHALYV